MTLSQEQVRKIARLARIELTDDEVVKYQSQLGDILKYFEKLKEVDTSSVESSPLWMSHACPLRPDEVDTTVSAQDLVNCTPQEVLSNQIAIKNII